MNKTLISDTILPSMEIVQMLFEKFAISYYKIR